MTHILKTSTAALAAVLCLAGVAHADGVKVSLVGKSSATIHAEILQAAKSVCGEATAADQRTYGTLDECVSATVAVAMTKVAAQQGGYAMAKSTASAR